MDAAIKSLVLPRLRQLGFKGSLPHLHRLRNGACDYLTFQFLSAGGAFTVELARGHEAGLSFHGRHIPVAKVNTTYLHPRHRLGASLSGGDRWYHFNSGEPEAVAREVLQDLDYPSTWQLIDGFPLPGTPP